MEKLRGKCKTCLGCNKLEEMGFKGRLHCKYYISGETKEEFKDDERTVYLILLIEVILYMMFLGYFYIKFNALCGG